MISLIPLFLLLLWRFFLLRKGRVHLLRWVSKKEEPKDEFPAAMTILTKSDSMETFTAAVVPTSDAVARAAAEAEVTNDQLRPGGPSVHAPPSFPWNPVGVTTEAVSVQPK